MDFRFRMIRMYFTLNEGFMCMEERKGQNLDSGKVIKVIIERQVVEEEVSKVTLVDSVRVSVVEETLTFSLLRLIYSLLEKS